MALMSEVTAWADFVNVQLSLAEIDERKAQKILDKAKDTVLLREWVAGDKDARVTIAKAERALDPEVQKASYEFDVAHAYRKKVQALYENLERDGFLLSRELSRRIGRREVTEKRTDRYAR